jgi:ribose-phosphate pyrophosphokinase
LENGATGVRAVCTHPILSGPAYERIQDSVLKELIVTNSVPLKEGKPMDKITVLDVSELFASVLENLIENKSISSKFIIS